VGKASVGIAGALVQRDFGVVKGIAAVRPRRGPHRRRPGKLRADKAYHSAGTLRWLRERGIAIRIARPGIESSERLGRHRWEIERSIAWLFGRLTIRYRTQRQPLPRLPRPRRYTDLLGETRQLPT